MEFLRTGEQPELEPQPPAPFRQRLAAYAKCDESEVMVNQPKHSSMQFRIFAPIGPYVGPKPVWFIRLLLTRIHRLVSNTGNGR